MYHGMNLVHRVVDAVATLDRTGLQEYGSLINLIMQPFSFDAMQKAGTLLTPFVGSVWRGCKLSEADQSKC